MDEVALIFEIAPMKNDEGLAIETGCGPATMALTEINRINEVAALRTENERSLIAITKLGSVVVTIDEPAIASANTVVGGDTSPGI